MMIAHIDKKRKALGIDKARERVLMDMADRQALEANRTIKSSTKEERMSRLVAFAAIQGGYNIVSKVKVSTTALGTYHADTKVGFPNTAYYLPVIYSLLGIKVETLEDMKKPLEFARKLLPPHVKGSNHLPYLGPLLDAGMAALFAFEIEEALRYLNEPDFYLPTEEPDLEAGKIWLGAADDTIMRKRGVEFVDGSAPGFAAIVGRAARMRKPPR
jgi:acetyl-CoA synthase